MENWEFHLLASMSIGRDPARFLYLAINALIILFPFLLSFDRKVEFRKRWPALVPAYISVCLPFIVWDMIMIKYDHWGFNTDYIIGLRLFNCIPIEEVLFFFTVPFACAFTYEALRYYLPKKAVPFSRIPYIALGLISMGAAIPFLDQFYTASVLVILGIVLIAAPLLSPGLFRDLTFFVFLIAVTVLFVIFNYLLTSIPIVWYWHGSIWGGDEAWNGRFITIPYEDFIYNFALLIGYLAVYFRFRDSWRIGSNGTRKEGGTYR
jgi:lycopene cyclase domain-containing protein